MLNFTHATKLLAIAIIMSSSACSKKDINEPQQPTLKGDFKVQINNAPTKAVVPNGSDAERKINNLHLFLYESGSNDCALMHPFTTSELEAAGGPTAIFSLPKEDVALTTAYDIYAVANTTITTWNKDESTTWPTITDLKALHAADIAAYNTGSYAEAVDANGDSKVMPNGIGFLMSGKANEQAKPAPDKDIPTQVTIPLKRAVSKFVVNASITDAFKTNYQDKYKSTIKVKSVNLTNLPSQSLVIKETTEVISPLVLADRPQTSGDKELTTVGAKVPVALVYSFENGAIPTSEETPLITIVVEYDFDGPNGGNEPRKLTYEAQIIQGDGVATTETTDDGKLSRNSQYTINVAINGLSAREIVSTITVENWILTADQDAGFGG